jgi:hypothetical protein
VGNHRVDESAIERYLTRDRRLVATGAVGAVFVAAAGGDAKGGCGEQQCCQLLQFLLRPDRCMNATG